MKKAWPKVRLGEVLVHRKEFIQIDDLTSYKRPRVQLHAQGIVLRDEVPGALIKTKKQQVCRAGDFLVAEIDAKVGGFGIVPKSLEGAIVSSHYFLFEVNTEKLDRRFLDYFIRTPMFRDQVEAQGSTNYAAIRPGHVLDYEMPLPHLDEQRRLVAQIEELAEQINDVKPLRQKARIETEALCGARMSVIFRGLLSEGAVPLDTVCKLERGKFSHRPRNDPRFFGGNYPWIQIGEIEGSNKLIKSWSQTLNEEGLAISKLFPRGTVLISIAATIGAVGILDFDCCIPDSIVGVTPEQDIDSEFMYYYLGFMRKNLEEIAPQSAQKNINLKILSVLPFPKIPLANQKKIVAELDILQAATDDLVQVQAEEAVELDALIPAILDRAFNGEL